MFALKIYALLAMNRQTLYILAACLSIVGVVSFFLLIREVLRTVTFLRGSRRAEGKIEKFESYRNSEGSTKYRAVVSFTTPNERLYTTQATIAFPEPTPKIGTIVKIRYLSDEPQNAKIENFWEIWETSLLYFTIFFAMSFLTFIIYLVAP